MACVDAVKGCAAGASESVAKTQPVVFARARSGSR